MLSQPKIERRRQTWCVRAGGCLPLVFLPLLALAQPGEWGSPERPIHLHYQERPPYTETLPGGAVRGLVATPAASAMERAGISYRWVLTPSQRQLAVVQNGTGPDCALGWFRNPQRESVGKFSKPLYRDQPLAAFARKSAPLQSPMGLEDALKSPHLRILTKEGYSYGSKVDRMLQAHPAQRVTTASELNLHVGMLLAGRADWMLAAPEEAEVLFKQAAEQRDEFKLVPLGDMDAGGERHLYCSPAVPDALMARLDRALPALPRAAGKTE